MEGSRRAVVVFLVVVIVLSLTAIALHFFFSNEFQPIQGQAVAVKSQGSNIKLFVSRPEPAGGTVP
jgi:uncharacterized protein involved in outer membrane biogenesis